MIRLLIAGLAATIALSAASLAAATPPDDSGNPKKEYVCHHTASEKNPVVIINVGNAAVPAHVVSPSHGHTGPDASSDDRPEDAEDCRGGN